MNSDLNQFIFTSIYAMKFFSRLCLFAALIIISCGSIVNASTNAPDTKSVTLKIQSNQTKGGIFSTILSIVSDTTPEPYNTVAKVANTTFGFLFPSPNKTQKQLDEISKQLNDMDQLLVDINLITDDTHKEVKDLSQEYAKNEYLDSIDDLGSPIINILSKNDSFYETYFIFEDNEEYYLNAVRVCANGKCNQNESNMVKFLFGGAPKFDKNIKKSGDNCNSNNPANILLSCYVDLLNPQKITWEILNNKYNSLLKTAISNEKTNNKVTYYLAAMSPIVRLQMNYISALNDLYYMNKAQLAMTFAHPQFFEGESSGFPFALSSSYNEKGFNESVIEMDKYFEKLSSKLKKVFGSTSNNTHISGIINYVSEVDFLNSISKGAEQNSNITLLDPESINDSCWISSFNFDTKTSGYLIGTMDAKCEITLSNNDIKFIKTSYTIPYKTDALNKLMPSEYILYDIKYIDDRFQYTSNLALTRWSRYLNNTTPESEALTTPGWVFQPSEHRTENEFVFSEVFIETANNNQLLPISFGQPSPNSWKNSTRKDFISYDQNGITYKSTGGNIFRSTSETEKWAKFHIAYTNNGHGYLIRGTFPKTKGIVNDPGFYWKKSQIFRLVCLLNDDSCTPSTTESTLTWTDGTEVSLIATDQPDRCPDKVRTHKDKRTCSTFNFSVKTLVSTNS